MGRLYSLIFSFAEFELFNEYKKKIYTAKFIIILFCHKILLPPTITVI